MIANDWLLFDSQMAMACSLNLLNVKTDKFSKVLLSKETHAQLKHWTLIVKSKVRFVWHFLVTSTISSKRYPRETNLKFCQKNILVQILVKLISNHTWNIKCI